MAKTFQLEIITPDRVTLRDEVEMVIVPALDGELGVLAGHTPLVTGLKIGVIRVKLDGRWLKVSTSGGFMEVQPQKVTMVVSTAELPEEIDVERALAAKERAERRLNQENIDHTRARAALERAIARLKAADRL